MNHKKKLFSIFLILLCWAPPLLSATLLKIVGYFEIWHGFVFFILSLISFSFEFKIGRGRIGIEPLSLLPIALIFKSPIAVALSAFFGAFFGSFLIKKRQRDLLTRISFSSTFIFPYSICALISYKLNLPVLYMILEFTAFTFIIYTLLFLLYFFVYKKPIDAGFFITVLGWLVSFLSFSPLIYLEIVLYNSYGILGLFFPLLPVGIIVYSLKKSAEEIISMEEKKKHRVIFSLVKTLINGTFQRDEPLFSFEPVLNNLKTIIKFDSAAIILWETLNVKETGDFEIYYFGKVKVEKEKFKSFLKKLQLPLRVPEEKELEYLKKELPLNKEEPYSLIMPIKTAELYLGLLYLSGKNEELKDEKSNEFLNLVVDSIGLSFQNSILAKRMAEAKEKLEKDSEILSNLLKISYEITIKSDVYSVLQRITESLHRILNVKWVLISTYSKEKKAFCPRAQYGFERIWERIKDEIIPEEKVFSKWEISTHISKSYVLFSKDYIQKKYKKDLPLPEDHILSTIYIPLKSQEELLGFLQVEGLQFNKDLEEKISLLELFANQASYSLTIINTYEKLHNLSIKDPLTDAYNFRYFKEVLEKEIKKYSRLKNNFSIAIMDLDNFKEINDRYGHLAGDFVLLETVKLIKKQIREEVDMVFRYGGDEFALFFPSITEEKLPYLLERIRKKISENIFEVNEEGNLIRININISIGGASFPSHSKDMVNLIGCADKALLKAKAKGKNTVEIYKNE